MKLALFDIDGVCLNDSHRIHFALAKDWASYFDPAIMVLDDAFAEGLSIVRAARDGGWDVAYLTGRRSALRHVTELTLSAHDFPFAPLYMREPEWLDEEGRLLDSGTWPKDVLAMFKVNEIRRLVSLYTPEAVVLFEDDPEVVRLVNESAFATNVEATLVNWSVKPQAMVKAAVA